VAVSSSASVVTVHAPEPVRHDATTPGTEPRLNRLLRLSGHGNQSAFGAFYDTTAPDVYRLALRMGLDTARAERVTEKVFVHAWRHSARYDPADGDPQTWVLTIAHRKSMLLIRAMGS
jgi:RNA polymerase sigma-70 factor (ECF subfamily)